MLGNNRLIILLAEFATHWMTLPEHGPVLLASAALRFYAGRIDPKYAEDWPEVAEYAHKIGALQMLAEVAEKGAHLGAVDVNAVGYKSILKGVLTAVLEIAGEVQF